LGTRLYQAVNVFVAHHAWLGRLMASIESWSVPLLAAAIVSLWLLDRPGRRPRSPRRRWRSWPTGLSPRSGMAIARSSTIRPRTSGVAVPTTRRFRATTSAPFAIALAVMLVDPFVGALILAAAVVIATSRVLVGVHYPADVGAGIVVGDAAALLVRTLARRPLALAARAVERLTEGVLGPIWRHVSERGR
jgi:hypothetical protein